MRDMNQDQIKELIDKGLTLQAIADEIGTTKGKLRHFLFKLGLKTKNPVRLLAPITKKELLDFMDLNYSSYEMARALNCSQYNVRYWLKKFDLKSRKVKGNLRNSEGKIDPIKTNNNHKKCPKCDKLLKFDKDNFYINSSGKIYSWCLKCSEKDSMDRQRARKQECLDYLGGKCVICGYNKYQGALDFHHIDPAKKSFSLSKSKLSQLEILKPELDKCVILCSNCHRELHGGLIKLE